MSSCPALGTTSKICQKSPPRTTIFPPKIFLVASTSSNYIKSCKVRSTALKAQRCIISASSQMIRSALCTNSATFICCVMLQVDSLCRSIGILNLEWAVLPPINSKDAILDEAIASTILPYVRSIPSAMGVESKVEAMDNAQERLCRWSHVLCTTDIG
ncbi:hypothetical protein CY35_06G110500 [Sphagnum magellanicum]|nr:hypothetical protein CY35_06G110500 [Sphagnum magellanicum]